MIEVKKYMEWERIICQETNCTVYDPDGYRAVVDEHKEDVLMTKEQAFSYFIRNTLEFRPESMDKLTAIANARGT